MRLSHIDRMRAIAVLCMVEVHTAAIIPPEGISVGHPAAFVAAAFGGMPRRCSSPYQAGVST